VPFAEAVARRLRTLDAAITLDQVVTLIDGHREDDIRKALHATLRGRPELPLAFFRAALGRRVAPEIPVPRMVRSVRNPSDPFAP
jgi:hypothetical protein